METPKQMPRLNLRPTRGDTFQCQLKFKDSEGSPVDWQGYSARSQVRPSPESETVLVEFDKVRPGTFSKKERIFHGLYAPERVRGAHLLGPFCLP